MLSNNTYSQTFGNVDYEPLGGNEQQQHNNFVPMNQNSLSIHEAVDFLHLMAQITQVYLLDLKAIRDEFGNRFNEDGSRTALSIQKQREANTLFENLRKHICTFMNNHEGIRL